MHARDLGQQAWESVHDDRRQALLALAGIACGVGAVVAALAVGEGARREAIADVEALGVDNVIVRSVSTTSNAAGRGGAPRLTLDDATAIERGAADAVAVASIRSIPTSVSMGSRSAAVTVIGATRSWQAVMAAGIGAGRWLVPSDLAERRRVVVLGAGVADRLANGRRLVGQLVKMRGDWYRVVGVLAGRADPGARRSVVSRFDLQEAALVPLTALDAPLGPGDDLSRVEEIAVRARSAERIPRLTAAIDTVLRQRVASGSYEVVVPRELVAARVRARRAFDAVLAAFGCLVLVVSGIGIMNVMLAGVTRRTVEIGVRRAVGARRADIVAQFAAESGLLSIAGALVGLPTGAAASAAIGALAGWATAVSVWAAVLTTGMAALVGVAFGVYPAYLAGCWTPCNALRRE